ncbi:hypothetical protein [Noviherbaspirillum sp. Root189]|nr:hypothetical protein [Noviherbaspirillum sp. Root189]
MRVYLTAIVLASAATFVILNACVLKGSPTRAAPDHILQLK